MATPDKHLQEFEREILQAPRTSYNVQLKLYDVLIPVICGIIICMNLMVVFSSGLILRKRQQPRSTYIFLGNVALADMLIGVATIFGQYFPKEGRTEIICCIQIGLIISSTLASVYSIALIGVDRFLYILYGLQYQVYLSSKRARFMVLGTWILGGIVGFLPVMGVRNPTESGRFCWLIILEPTALVLGTVLVGVIPLILIIILYSIILKRALGKISEMRGSENATKLRYFRGGRTTTKTSVPTTDGGERVSYIETDTVNETATTKRSIFNCCRKSSTLKITSIYSPSRWKAIKIVALTTGCFFVTWFPYFLACALYAMCDQELHPLYCDNLRIAIASPLAILGLANSLFNPIIYAWWHNGFRESAKKIYNDLWQQRTRLKVGTSKKVPNTRNVGHITQPNTEEEPNTNSTQVSKTISKDVDVSVECEEVSSNTKPAIISN